MTSAETPMGTILQMYILDIMGELPPERLAALEKMNLSKALKTRAADWRGAIHETLHLSDTFSIAVWDIWLKNREQLAAEATSSYKPAAYARDFVDQFLQDGSQIDVWPDNSLEIAKQRLQRHGKFLN